MSTARSLQLCVSATILFAAGMCLPASAHAAPCSQWRFDGPTSFVEVNGAWTLSFDDSDATVDYIEALVDPAPYPGIILLNGRIKDNGTISLKADPIEYMVNWTYQGFVNERGYAYGDLIGWQGDTEGSWKSAEPLACADSGPAPEDSDSPAEEADSPSGDTMEVTGDVDVYDVPGGVGEVIGILRGGQGQTVEMGSGCRDDSWCNIVWADGPNGTAWVWGDFLSS